jgi:putative membrane protein
MNRRSHVIRNLVISAAVAALMSYGAVAQGRAQMSTASANKGQSSTLTAADRIFIKKAAEGGQAEVELGQLAGQKASSEEVKKFGQRMVDDHTKTNDQLKQLASRKGVNVPEKLNAKDKATKARLSRLSGEQFDRAYMNDMVTDHTKDVAEFRQESKSAKDPDVKNFASQTLPTLQDHLKEARTIAPKEKRQTASKTSPM